MAEFESSYIGQDRSGETNLRSYVAMKKIHLMKYVGLDRLTTVRHIPNGMLLKHRYVEGFVVHEVCDKNVYGQLPVSMGDIVVDMSTQRATHHIRYTSDGATSQ